MTEEKVYYQSGDVTITGTRAILGGKTYAMANITSVSMGKVAANRVPGIAIAVGGIAIGGCIGALSESGGMWALGAVFLIIGVAVAVMAKPKYIVRIGSASGETDALTHEDQDYIQKIVTAMNEAIINRG